MSSQHLGDSDELAARLHSAVLHLLRRLAREDRATGESPARLSALSVLVFSGPRPIGRLARDERVSAPTMTRLVAGLEADGLVTRAADPGDRPDAADRGHGARAEILVAGRARRVAASRHCSSGSPKRTGPPSPAR